MATDKNQKEQYDYIIAGSGLSGLSLLYHMLQEEKLKHKRILVIDKEQKQGNDRTWSYWEKGQGMFESIVNYQWTQLAFYTTDFKKNIDLKEYAYKMILSADFYSHVLNFAQSFSNVIFVEGDIKSIQEITEGASVDTSTGRFTAPYVFNSTGIFYPKMDGGNTLLQHFLGWRIVAEEPVFDLKRAVLMDFRPSQLRGTTFMYVLPTSATEAMIEYTLFTENVLEKEEYIIALKKYIKDELGIKEYQIEHEEFGIIPMSLAKFPKYIGKQKRIINIGTAGGDTKSCTGYTFQFVQKNVAEIVRKLSDDIAPAPALGFRDKMFEWHDRTLLDVLLNDKMTGKDIFSYLFKSVPPERILAFLANESTFWEEFQLRNAVPILPFMTSGIRQLF